MIQRVVNNFYLRNLVVFAAAASPYVLSDHAEGKTVLQALYTQYNIVLFYLYTIFHNRVLYENLLAKKRYVIYFIIFFSTMLIWKEGTSYLEWLVTKPDAGKTYVFDNFNNIRWISIYWNDTYYTYLAFGIYICFKYFRENERLLKIINAQRGLELKQLNEQLNPHFLFNALNNIYSHTMGRGKDAGALILKLGDIMRYVLNNSQKESVLLSEEISFIENYITFEMERAGYRCTLSYQEDISTENFKVVPLILFTFIENAFKHGTVSAGHSDIVIHIAADEKQLDLYTSNPVWDHIRHSTKTGLSNARRRLELHYPHKHKLNINHTEHVYEVSLIIKNKTHETALHYS